MRTKRASFEELYDPKTGLWHFPPDWSDKSFDASCVDKWRRELPLHGWPVEKEVGQLYMSLVQLLRPRTILETGTNMGYSAYCLADALAKVGEDTLLFTLDLVKAHHLFAGTEIEKHINFVEGNSLEVDLGLLTREGEKDPAFDMLIVDSDHRYKTVLGEINRFAPYLRHGGVVVMHDTMCFDGVGLVVQQMSKTGLFETINLPSPRKWGVRPTGVTIARKIAEISGNCLVANEENMEIYHNLPERTELDYPLVG